MKEARRSKVVEKCSRNKSDQKLTLFYALETLKVRGERSDHSA
jgi:hypothetical protein